MEHRHEPCPSQVLASGAGAAALPGVSHRALALDYPKRPVKILVGFPAGGAVDIVARLIGDWLSQCLGGQFFVENRAGAANNIATQDMIRSSADGYTLLLTDPTNAINATFYAHLNYNFLRDIPARPTTPHRAMGHRRTCRRSCSS